MSEPVLNEVRAAAARFQAGDFVAALALAEQVLVRAPRDAEALHMRALALGRLGRIDEAVDAYAAAETAHPKKQAILNNLGNALRQAKRLDEAVAAYRRAVAFDPSFANAWLNLGIALNDLGDRAGALDAMQAAARLGPDNPNAHNSLGALLEKAGDLEAAAQHYDAALSARPDFVPALVNRGRVKRDRGDLQGAIADLERAGARAPASADANHQLANAYRAAGRAEEADRAYRRALEAAPQSASAHRDFAGFLWESGRRGEFLSALDAAARTAPSTELLDLLAELAFLSGDPDRSEQAAGRLRAEFPQSPQGYARLARVRRHQGRKADAVDLARRACAAAPQDFAVRHDLAEALLVNGQYTEAKGVLEGEAPRAHLQRHVALRSLALRALGDPAYRRDYDYDRLVAKRFIDPPQGYASVDAFNAALLEAIAPLHEARRVQPVDQTLYGGTQSLGRLWEEPAPVFKVFKSAMLAAARRYVEALPDGPVHPFLAHKTTDLACAGAWSVRLASGGGHVDHFHPKGWISATYYVRVPTELEAAEKAGFLRLGASGVAGLDLPAERWIRPEEGAVVFFPSYIWHGVEPFAAASERVAAPFDLAPRLSLS
jgi:uncharacterized protein (TIGR02466 family)